MIALALFTLLLSASVRADLHDPNNSADYIILTNQEVLSNNAWIDSLANYRASQGRVPMVVTTAEINEEFGEGLVLPIREFLHYAHENWQEPRLRDVFIIGHLNVVRAAAYIGHDSQDGVYYSDYFYAATDPESAFVPAFRIGRLPILSQFSDPAPNFFEKIRAYEMNPPDSCPQGIHVIAGPQDDYLLEQIGDSIASRCTNYDVERDFLGREPGDPAYGNHEEILANLNTGPFFTFVADHAGGYTWGYSGVGHADVLGLSNGPCYSIYSGMTNRDLGDDLFLNSVMGSAVLAENGAAIAVLGNSAVTWTFAGQRFEYKIAEALNANGFTDVGDIWQLAVESYLDQYDAQGNQVVFETVFSNLLLGDPATIIPGRATGIGDVASPIVPTTIQIVGNYPNPFNPSTTINFMLSRAGNARLTVYDITGRAVTTLAEQSFTAGQHSIVWNAAGLASGIYLVRLESAGQFDTHKITLLK